MRTEFLANRPEYIDTLAPALLEHWAYASPEDTLEARRRKLTQHLNRDALPMAWVAHDAGEVMGTAALRRHDLESHKELTPWLGGVFVMPAFRRSGIGSKLCETVERFAGNLGIGTLYLFTVDQQRLYTKLGYGGPIHAARINWKLSEHSPLAQRATKQGNVLVTGGTSGLGRMRQFSFRTPSHEVRLRAWE